MALSSVQLLKRKILNLGALQISRIKLIPVLNKMPKNALVIDCGANRGDISAIFARRGHQVHAFEPDPIAYKTLQERANQLPQIKLYNKAVGIKNESAKLFFHKEQGEHQAEAFTVSSSLVGEKINVSQENFQTVDVINLGNFIDSLCDSCGKKVDVLKMDIEGAEVDILESFMANETYRKIGLILVETHENKIPSQRPRIANIKDQIKARKIDNIKLNWI